MQLPSRGLRKVGCQEIQRFLQSAAVDPQLVHRIHPGAAPHAVSLADDLAAIGLQQLAADQPLPARGRCRRSVFHYAGLLFPFLAQDNGGGWCSANANRVLPMRTVNLSPVGHIAFFAYLSIMKSDSPPRTSMKASKRNPLRKGKLIVVEGIDGSGKSTQVQLLLKWLEARGEQVFFTEWNSSELVRQATKRGKKKNLLTPSTFSLLHATEFADRLTYSIIPYLKAGMTVLADRYVYTAFARDIARGVDPKWVRDLYSFAVEPDMVFYFRVPIDVAVGRILGARSKIKFYEAGMDLGLSQDPAESFRLFQGRVLEEYDRLSAEDRFQVIDGTRSIDAQQQKVRAGAARLFSLAAQSEAS